MKKLTIKALKEIISKKFMISNYVGIIKDKNTFYVVYRDRVVNYRFSPACGWCFSISGYGFYTDTRDLLSVVPILDENYIGDNINDND